MHKYFHGYNRSFIGVDKELPPPTSVAAPSIGLENSFSFLTATLTINDVRYYNILHACLSV